MDIVIASNNKGKIKEIKEILACKFENIYSLKDLNLCVDVEENGKTFYDNALLKARETSLKANMPALADDSGLCVVALGGQPGVFSARFSGENATDESNMNLLLKKMEFEKNRECYFYSCVVLYVSEQEIYVGSGRADGKLLFEKVGKSGFGYDPIFYSDEIEKSFAQASDEEKNTISHRKRALESLLENFSKGQG